MIRVALISLVALAIVPVASAATPIYWTPTHMAKAVTALNWPAAAQPIFKVACKGSTVARKGTFGGFRCTVTYIGHATKRVFVKPLPQGRVCGSMVSLAACRILASGPLAGDPTVCYGKTGPGCVGTNAKAAALARWKAQTGYSNPVPVCTGTGLTWQCTMADGKVYTVTFTKGATSWTTTVTP